MHLHYDQDNIQMVKDPRHHGRGAEVEEGACRGSLLSRLWARRGGQRCALEAGRAVSGKGHLLLVCGRRQAARIYAALAASDERNTEVLKTATFNITGGGSDPVANPGDAPARSPKQFQQDDTPITSTDHRGARGCRGGVFVRGNHLSNTTCLTQALFNSGE